MAQISKPKSKRDWIPTEPVFRSFLQWLDEGSDSHGERYLEMRIRLVRYFDRKRCFSADDLADETLTRVARRLEEEKTLTASSPAHYCYIVAKFVFLEHVRQTRIQTAAIESDSSLVATASGVHLTPERPEAEREQTECLETCLEKLASGDRNLILEYYHGEQREKIRSRRELGEKLGLTSNALSIRACRIRGKLEACVTSCCDER